MPPPGPADGVTVKVSIANAADMVMSALIAVMLYDVTAPTGIEAPPAGPAVTSVT
jgi:hypothetical protein